MKSVAADFYVYGDCLNCRFKSFANFETENFALDVMKILYKQIFNSTQNMTARNVFSIQLFYNFYQIQGQKH